MAFPDYLSDKNFRAFKGDPLAEDTDVADIDHFFKVEGPVHKNWFHPENTQHGEWAEQSDFMPDHSKTNFN